MGRKLGTDACGRALGAVALGLAAAWKLAAQDRERTVREGVYSPAQAARGARLFESICTNCHEIAEFTAAGAYLEDVEGQPLWETFEYISAEMPEDDPGSLRPEDYAAVLAYIFSVYGLPSGATDLARRSGFARGDQDRPSRASR